MNRNKFKPRNSSLRGMAAGMRGEGHEEIPHFKKGGFFKKALGILSPVTQMVRHPKKLLPVAGAVIGNMVMPGLGGSMMGGAIGGAASSKKHPFEHALAGAGMGALGHYTLGSGTTPEWMGNIGSKLGFTGKAAAGAKTSGLLGGNVPAEAAQAGWGDKMMKLMADNPLETGLAALTLGGTLLSKPKKQKGESGHQEGSLSDMIANNQRIAAAHSGPSRRVKPMNRKPIPYTSEQWFSKPGMLPFYEDASPETEYYAQGGCVPHFAAGGYVDQPEYSYAHGGYIEGDDGGQSDKIPVHMNPGDYVMDSTSLSLLGDGNSKNGNKQFDSWEEKSLASGIVNDRNYGHSHRVRALVSPSERIIKEPFVTALGKGNNTKGAKMFDRFRKRLRTHKGLKPFLPPKSKPIGSYLKER